MKPNEEDACKAFIKILSTVTGRQYEIERLPEVTNRTSPDVECILISKAGHSPEIAVEHTIVESFEDQMAYVNQSYDIVEEVNVQSKGRLPVDRYYYLIVPPPLVRSLRGRRRKEFVVDVSLWVASIAKTLAVDQGSLPHDHYKVKLGCGGSFPGMDGNVFRCPTQPEKAEELQRARFRRAISEKERKLRRYKEKGFGTALLLEDVGGSLRDHKARWRDLTRTQKRLICESVDYMVILVSNNQKMITGRVWKEEARRPYSEIPQDRKFSFRWEGEPRQALDLGRLGG